jgi:endonuclease/exonuclease/phosphatase family metal-dependent hydrolase
MDWDRLLLQFRLVKQQDPDIICLQEVYDERIAVYYERVLKEYDLVYSPDDILSAPFPASLIGSVASLLVAPSDISRAAIEGNRLGLALLVKKTLSTSGRSQKYYPSYAPKSLPLTLFEMVKPRGYLSAMINLNGHRVHIFNTVMSNGVENPGRMEQAKSLLKGVNEKGRRHEPVIVCGDTNADGEQPEMRFLRSSGFVDTYLTHFQELSSAPHKGVTWDANNYLTDGYLREPDQRIDYIFFLPGRDLTFKISDSRIVFDSPPFVSDHYGLVTDLNLVEM